MTAEGLSVLGRQGGGGAGCPLTTLSLRWLHDGLVPAGSILEGVGTAVTLYHCRARPSA